MCLKVKLKSAIKNALSFSFDARRISVMFSVMALSFFGIVFSLISLASYLPTQTAPFANMAQIIPNYAGKLLLVGIIFAAVLFLSAVLSVLIKGVFIHNYATRDSKEATIKNSIDALGGRIMPLIFLTLAVVLISVLLDSIKFLGGILSALFSLSIFFAYQELIIAKKGVSDSIKGSYLIFRESWKDVIVSLIACTVSIFAIVMVFLIPFSIVFAITLSGISEQSLAGTNLISDIYAAAAENSLQLIVSGIFAFIGLSVATLFSNAFTTDIYLQLKGRKPESSQNVAAVQKSIVAAEEAKKPAAKRKAPSKKSRGKKRK